ncbi:MULTISPECIES: hypothetical protein [Pseudomonas]|uniref:hypothetical protein n=1 Tax=Pseudomonas TaxID=286 RepID=UPI001F56D3A1|nr:MULTISPECIES: hypothetical protein [unclassified Pseudomonas]MCV2225724.1 hypothetical protein [Pseudomonas sp. AU10]
MRYLKATAQDRSGNGKADMVVLQIFEQAPNEPDEMIHEAVAIDITADGAADILLPGDINRDGCKSAEDKTLLKRFTDTYLTLNWFNCGDTWARYMTIRVMHTAKNGAPNAIQLSFYECSASRGKRTLVYTASGYDGDSDGVLESFTNSDVDRNGIADHSDKAAIKALCNVFLALVREGAAWRHSAHHGDESPIPTALVDAAC